MTFLGDRMRLGEAEETLGRCLSFPPLPRAGHPSRWAPIAAGTRVPQTPEIQPRQDVWGFAPQRRSALVSRCVALPKEMPLSAQKRAPGLRVGVGGNAGLENGPLHLAIKFGLETSSCFLTKCGVFSAGSNARKSRIVKGVNVILGAKPALSHLSGFETDKKNPNF